MREPDYRNPATPQVVVDLVRVSPPGQRQMLGLAAFVAVLATAVVVVVPPSWWLCFPVPALLALYALDGRSSAQVRLQPQSGLFELVTKSFLMRTRRATFRADEVVEVRLERIRSDAMTLLAMDRVLLRMRDGKELDLFGRPLAFDAARAKEVRDTLSRLIDQARTDVPGVRVDQAPDEEAEGEPDEEAEASASRRMR